jgi:hypothetical protein
MTIAEAFERLKAGGSVCMPSSELQEFLVNFGREASSAIVLRIFNRDGVVVVHADRGGDTPEDETVRYVDPEAEAAAVEEASKVLAAGGSVMVPTACFEHFLERMRAAARATFHWDVMQNDVVTIVRTMQPTTPKEALH